MMSNELDIRFEISKLNDERRKVLDEKRELEAETSVLKNRVRSAGRTRLPQEEYKGICRRQNWISNRRTEIERQLSAFQSEIEKWRAIESEEHQAQFRKNGELIPARQIDLAGQLTALRDYYLRFSEDSSRVNSMRLLASQFARELTTIIGTFLQ